MRLAAVFLLALSCGGAVVGGVVVEDETGYPLAWSQVSLVPLAGTKAPASTQKAGSKGTFTFSTVPAGWYVLRTTREGFADNEAGQMRPGRPGIPFQATVEGRSYFQIRMRRMGAITGSVLDHNNVGVPDWPVQVYTAQKPLRRVTSGLTDDRGIFRIGLLESGSYVVRSGGGTLEDGTGLLPSYYPYGTSADTAEAVRVRVGETRPDVTIRAAHGRLFEIGGVFSSPVQARLTLVTQSGRAVIASVTPPAGPVSFAVKDLPPGPFELIAEGTQCGSHTRLDLERDLTGLRVNCGALATPTFEWAPNVFFPVAIRRFDMDQTGPERILGDREALIPGRYELMPEADSGHYVASVQNAPQTGGWFLVEISGSPRISVIVSAHPASIHGKVSSGGRPSPGATVYLERIDGSRQWVQRADSNGNYRFGGLPPGTYRILSSFDYDPEDRRPMNAAPVIDLKEGDEAARPLETVLP